MDTKNAPTIHGSVLVGGKSYVAGQEAALATAMKGKSFDRLLSKGVVSGNWGQAPASPPEAPEASPAEAPEVPAGEATEEPAPPPAAPAKKTAAKKSARKKGGK